MTSLSASSERERLIQEAAEAMRGNGRIPELHVLRSLPDEMLEAIIGYHAGPFRVA